METRALGRKDPDSHPNLDGSHENFRDTNQEPAKNDKLRWMLVSTIPRHLVHAQIPKIFIVTRQPPSSADRPGIIFLFENFCGAEKSRFRLNANQTSCYDEDVRTATVVFASRVCSRTVDSPHAVGG